ncbi:MULTISPECIES: acyltransferase family protein [Enterobacteriaceae]|nr:MULTISPECIES: acyltransferase [Enterobacteriaceae]MCU3195191.1 acyltransferase [Enterobacter hormaechei subsp. hoffmannii]HED2223092.1 acyltransferase [Enterobacter hormaechei subsp. steigerwaltii]MCU3508075.1 acyltransferase [Enterobacter hormaechei subsp. hoffmannii]MCU3984320.1 acyltransferase [Enterobacter hormaechei subsp. hoffmannii]MDC6872942.1 acyltransferase [Escherichia coli]
MKHTRYLVLDSFRGLCALSIVIHHLAIHNTITEWSFFSNSAVLVEFFFMLSGFVLMHSYGYRKDVSLKKFFKARFYRIYPLHIFMLVIFFLFELIVYVFYHNGYPINNVPFMGRNGLDQIIPNLLLLQSWLPFSEPMSFNGVSWSISVEFYMYLILYLTLCLKSNFSYICWASFILISLIVLYTGYAGNYIYVLRGLSSFFIGTFTYVVVRNNSYKLNYKVETLCEFLIIIFTLYYISKGVDSPLILNIVFATLIIVFHRERGMLSKFLKNKKFIFLGDISYSLYLTHPIFVFLLIGCAIVINKVLNIYFFYGGGDSSRVLNFDSIFLNNMFLMFILIFVVLLACFTHVNIEKRFNKK